MEDKEIVVAFLSGEIYLAKVEENDVMHNDERVKITRDVLRAAAEWFISNNAKGIKQEGYYADDHENKHSYLFHTTDGEKAEKIKEILKDDEYEQKQR